MYQKERREFGRSVNHFSTTEPVPSGSFNEDPLEKEKARGEYIERSPTMLEISAIPLMSEAFVNTGQVEHRSHGMLHTEGGWPKDIDSTEKEQTTCAPAAAPRACRRFVPRSSHRRPCFSAQAVPQEGREGRGVH